ncbi:hypothetical protein [Archangium sp.]|uniref:hypothetical protein n=1 Tax=Archangium sp. TaxID=1872627 RepID=UPI002D222D1E|nr:hypothetical protein [Archangium sp.]HYO52982.1 hypothetical protein [Archangium sp.]
MASATDVRGTISTHTVWKRSGSPYVLKGDVTVDWGTRLTLEPGVQVIAAPTDAMKSGVDPERVELIVDGTLVVRGTAALPVEFTSQGGSGSWYGIRVRGGRGTVLDRAVITRAHQGISLGMSAAVKNTSVSAAVEDCIHVSWGTATLAGNELSGCGRREPDVQLSAQDGEAVRMATLQRPPPSEPSVRGRRVFMMAGQGTRGGVLVARITRHREELPSSSAPLARRTPGTAPAVTFRSAGETGTRVVALRPAGGTVESLRRRPWSRPAPPSGVHGTPPPVGTSPLSLYAETGGSVTGPPDRVECAHVPRVLESPECPGIRRWRRDQERLGEALSGVPSPHAPAPGSAGERGPAPPGPRHLEMAGLTTPG